MQTSLEWWNEIKESPEKLNQWLQKQCYGEFQAYKRISDLSIKFDSPQLDHIAFQELTHFHWIRKYLVARGISEINEHEERYWKQVKTSSFSSLGDLAAVGYHAEAMRLERIIVIANNTDSRYIELSEVFRSIERDERGHVAAFRHMSSDLQRELAKVDHEQGMISLGLIA